MMNAFIKTPLNYTGNKFRLLEQMQPFFPKDINIMVDLFCGGATVGLNTKCNEIYFIDNDPMVIGLLNFFSKQVFDDLVNKLEKIIDFYQLSNTYKNGFEYYKTKFKDANKNNGLKAYNSVGFYNLRNDYNSLSNKKTNKAFMMLYLLLLYGFNNDLRFNSKGEFNLPIGKTDFNKANVQKLQKYLEKVKTINTHYLCLEFDSVKTKHIIEMADFVYMDPPYLITNATYNESDKWNNSCEHKLLNFIDGLITVNKPFVLSNVLSKISKNNVLKMNEPLYYWLNKNKNFIDIKHMNYSYSSASYNKKIREGHEDEIIVTWKVKNEDKQ